MMKLNNELISSSSILINSKPENIWNTLTNPDIISEYLYGAETITDWKIGSEISFVIKVEDQTFIDKGIVIQNIPNQLLQYKYWSGFCGLEDSPENYSLVTYTIEKMDEGSAQFTWEQIGFADEESRNNSHNGLNGILQKIKSLSEL